MGKNNGLDRTILHSFSYPVYQLKAVGPNTLLAAGGGGNSKTGVPNRIDVIQITRSAYARIDQDINEALVPLCASVVGGSSTKHEAIMHMALGSQSPGAVSVVALEGSTCQEYFLHANELEPSVIADKVSNEQESAISSTGIAHNYKHQHTPSFSSTSSSEEGRTTGVSTTVKMRSAKSGDDKLVKKTVADSSGADQLPWTCKALRGVSVTPTAALMNRQRMDSCSSVGSVSSVGALIDDELTCITSGGPGGAWCAVGTVHGGVALIDRYSLVDAKSDTDNQTPTLSSVSPVSASYTFTFDDDEEALFPLQPFCTLTDASGGRCAPVCDVAISATAYTSSLHGTSKTSDDVVPVTPLLATISGRPVGSLLCIWRLPIDTFPGGITAFKRVKFADGESTQQPEFFAPILYAEVKMENAPIPADQKAAHTRSKKPENGTRFRHCEFLRWIHQAHPPTHSLVDSGLFTFLVTTEQPVSPTTRSICHLSVWLVPVQTAQAVRQQKQQQPVLGLERFASVPLPPGEIPACIAVHPSSERGVIALGTMEGSVDVFVISLRKRGLERVYSMQKAHPIFVTSLCFLPPRNRHPAPTDTASHQPLPPHYELVSSSADRVIRWHRGPSMERVASISTGLESDRSLLSARTVVLLFFVLLLPLILAPLNALLSR